MKILVTGGAGYLGGALSQFLIERGDSVRILDVAQTKYVPQHAEFILGDIRSSVVVANALRDIDLVFHLAFVQTPSDLPEELQRSVNVDGTRNLLALSLVGKLSKFVFVSTIEVYGSKPLVPISETAQLDPVGIYSIHKLECENMCIDFWRNYGLPSAIARLPIICGEGYYNHKALLGMIDWVLKDQNVFIPAPGTTVVDMIHIVDAIDALLLLAEKPEAIGQIFHFSAAAPASLLSLANTAIRATRSKSKIVLLDPRIVRLVAHIALLFRVYEFPSEQIDYLLNDFICDNTKARTILGYAPQFTATQAFEALVTGYMRDRNYIKQRRIGAGISES